MIKEEMGENNRIIVQINRNDLLITFNEKLNECTNAIFFGINSLDKIESLPEFLKEDKNSIFEYMPLRSMNVDESIENFKNWILKKGFEDLITALTELMISFSYMIDFNEKIKQNPQMPFGELRKLIFEKNEKNSKLHFPKLIEKVNSSLNLPFKFIEEVKTINNVRNCLVHRNGIVSQADFNSENGLELKWWYNKLQLKQGEKIKELEPFDLMQPEDELIKKYEMKTKLYQINERISFSFNEFFELSHFCQQVGFDILNKFELSEKTV